MNTKVLVEVRKKAEKAVSDMAEGPLKVKAFEMVFKNLLEGFQGQDKGRVDRNAKRESQKMTASSKDDKSATGRTLSLREEGFLSELKTIGEIREELAAHGWHYPVTTLSGTLLGLVQKKQLRRVKAKEGKKSVWKYCEP